MRLSRFCCATFRPRLTGSCSVARHGVSAVVLLINLFFGVPASRAEQGSRQPWWPQFHGPNRDKTIDKLSLTCADGMLYGLTQRGQLLLIAPDPRRLEVVSSFRLPEESRAPSFAHPVVCGGRLYVRRGEYLYAYDVRAE